MNICFLSMKGNFNRNLGQGVQIYIYEIWKNVDRFAPKSYNIEKTELGLDGGPSTRKLSFTVAQMFHDFSKYDIVHMPAPIMFNPRCKNTVTTVHEFFMLDESHPMYTKPKLNLNPMAIASDAIVNSIRNQILKSDYLLPNSTQTFEEGVRLGISRERMFMINHSIEDKFVTGRLPEARQGRFTAGYLGSMHDRKNVAFAIRSFSMTKSTKSTFEVWGNIKPGHSDVINEAAKNPNVKLKGFAPETKKVRIYDGLDLFLYPSLYEGFGKEILEAQARGVPVIIYKKGKIPKEVRKYCFEARDEHHMAQFIDSIRENGYNEGRRKKAARYARTFTWKKCATETIAAYKKIESNG